MANNSDPEYSYKENENYKKYLIQKEEIKKKYPSHIFEQPGSRIPSKKVFQQYIDSGDRELHQQYLKELADLIFEPNGNFQHMVWDIIPETELIEMERRSRGRIGNGEYT